MTAERPAEVRGTHDPDAVRIIRRSYWERWVGGTVASIFGAWIVYQILTNPGFQWGVVGKYMLHPAVLDGVWMTCELTVLVMVLGAILGVVIALMRLSNNPVVVLLANAYLWFFRGTPVLVQL